MNVVFVIIWLQHEVLAPNKHGVHFPVLDVIFNFLGKTVVRFVKSRLYVDINGSILDLVVLDLSL